MAHESKPWRYREIESRRLRFPLPQGEGKGEGEGNEDSRSLRMCGCVSLTPALSRWERESRSAASYGGPRFVEGHAPSWPCICRTPRRASLHGPRNIRDATKRVPPVRKFPTRGSGTARLFGC